MGGSKSQYQAIYPSQPQSASTSTTGPTSAIQPYLSNIYGLAKEQFRTQPPQTATYGDDFNQARDLITGTARGDYLYGGEGFNKALEAATNKILPQIQSRYARGGRFGSGLAQTAEASAIGDAFANLYSGERGRQEAAQQYLPKLSEAERSVEQQRLDEPYTRLQRYVQAISQLPGSTSGESSSTNYGQPYYKGSTGSTVAGSILGLASLIPGFSQIKSLFGNNSGGYL